MDKDGLISRGTFIEFSWHSYETDGLPADLSDIEGEPELAWLLNYTPLDTANSDSLPARSLAFTPGYRISLRT